MVISDYFIFILLVVYCVASGFMFIENLIYFIRCTYDSNFRKKQPVLWRESTIQDMVLTITFTWLPVIVLKSIIDRFD